MEVGIHMSRMGKWRIGLTGGCRGQLEAGRLWSGEHLNGLRCGCGCCGMHATEHLNHCFIHINIPQKSTNMDVEYVLFNRASDIAHITSYPASIFGGWWM